MDSLTAFSFSLRIINGVKEMCGFRSTFNLSYSSANETCSVASCSEDIAESTVLVSLSPALPGGVIVL